MTTGPVPAPAGPRRRWARWAERLLLIVAAVAAVVALVLAPSALGTGWSSVVSAVLAMDPGWLAASVIAWVAGLVAYSVVMTTSLPGLSARRALSLNLAGSAVANSLPLGGAMSLGLTAGMMRSWGFSRTSVTAFLTLTNAWNLLGRLAFGVLGLLWFVSAGLPPAVSRVLVVTAVVTGVLLVAAGAMGFSERLAGAITRRAGAARSEHLLELRRQVLDRSRRSWLRLSLGMAANLVLLGLLLHLCLQGLGVSASFGAALAAVGVERLVTALPLTPGGAGAAELSLLACLSAAGVPPADALAATLLYRVFTFAAEIPLGAAVTLWWRAGLGRRGTLA